MDGDRRGGPIDIRDKVRHGSRIVADAMPRRLVPEHATTPAPGGAVTEQSSDQEDGGPAADPHRARPAGRAGHPRRRLLRRPDGARHPQLPHQRPPAGHRAGPRRGPGQEGGCSREPRHGTAAGRPRGRHRARPRTRSWASRRTAARPAGAGTAGPAHRRLPGRSVPGGRRRQPQHEHQRGARQPGHRAPRRAGHRQRPARRLLGRQPQRPRQHGPVDQRHVPDRDAGRDARPDARRRSARSPELADAFAERAAAFDGVLKSGRTHMQDAVPIRLGQEFAAYALTIRRAHARMLQAAEGLAEQNIGATAVGTGLNAEPEYIDAVIAAAVGADRLPPADGRAPRPGHPVDGAHARHVRRAARVSRSTWPRSWRTCC